MKIYCCKKVKGVWKIVPLEDTTRLFKTNNAKEVALANINKFAKLLADCHGELVGDKHKKNMYDTFRLQLKQTQKILFVVVTGRNVRSSSKNNLYQMFKFFNFQVKPEFRVTYPIINFDMINGGLTCSDSWGDPIGKKRRGYQFAGIEAEEMNDILYEIDEHYTEDEEITFPGVLALSIKLSKKNTMVWDRLLFQT